MQRLKTVFRSRGFTYTQLKREGLAALYEQCSPGGTPAYEVIHLQVYPAGDRWGTFYPEREAYPGDEQWGKRGWTYTSLDAAQKAFARLVSSLRTQPAAGDSPEDSTVSTSEVPQELL